MFLTKKIVPLTMDGRKGLPEHGPYDVIHVGGALPKVPEELLAQLAPGGRMWIPVGPREFQSICIIDKDLEGEIHTEKLMDVRYGSLSSVDIQMADDF